MTTHTVALDSQRTIDESGHLHVARTVLSKAGVNPYFGREIPDYLELGLDPGKVYQMFRDPAALKAGSDTFRGKPLLIKHEYTDAEDHKTDLVIGSIGSNTEYDDAADTLYGDLTVWDAEAIELIDEKKMEELSASYWYRASMNPGVYKGINYHGIMLDIRGNHVALVARGRIGRDAIISDSLPFELEFPMLKTGAKQKISAKLQSLAKAGIANDSDVEEVVREVAENIEHKPVFDNDRLRELAGDNYEEILKLVGGETADDEDRGPKATRERHELEKTDEQDNRTKRADDEDEGPKAKAERKKLEETDRDDRDVKKDDKKEAAMDADSIALSVQSRIEAKYRARDKVEPLVGRIALDGFDDDASIYQYALSQKGISHEGVNTAGLAQLVAMASAQSKTRSVAQDSAFSEPSPLTSRFSKR